MLLSHRYRVEKQGFYPLTTIIFVYIMYVCLNHFFTFSCEVNGTVERILFYFVFKLLFCVVLSSFLFIFVLFIYFLVIFLSSF